MIEERAEDFKVEGYLLADARKVVSSNGELVHKIKITWTHQEESHVGSILLLNWDQEQLCSLIKGVSVKVEGTERIKVLHMDEGEALETRRMVADRVEILPVDLILSETKFPPNRKVSNDELKRLEKMLEIGYCILDRCEMAWKDMDETDDSRIRFCQACEKNVYFCDSLDTLEGYVEDDLCVAYDPESFIVEKGSGNIQYHIEDKQRGFVVEPLVGDIVF